MILDSGPFLSRTGQVLLSDVVGFLLKPILQALHQWAMQLQRTVAMPAVEQRQPPVAVAIAGRQPSEDKADTRQSVDIQRKVPRQSKPERNQPVRRQLAQLFEQSRFELFQHQVMPTGAMTDMNRCAAPMWQWLFDPQLIAQVQHERLMLHRPRQVGQWTLIAGNVLETDNDGFPCRGGER